MFSNASLSSKDEPWLSPYDIVVYGAGFVGYAAALHLAKRGRRILLLDVNGAELLWEATRALENRTATDAPSAAWSDWLETQSEGCDGEYFEPAHAEITAAARLQETAGLHVLFYAMPVAAERDEDGRVRAVTVATKSGFHVIEAQRWVDATEEGALLKLCGREPKPRTPAERWHSLVLHTDDPGKLGSAFAALYEAHPGLELLRSVKEGECRLRWPSGCGSGHRNVVRLSESLRRAANETGFDFAITHCGTHDFPVYAAGGPSPALAAVPGNVTVLSPGLRGEALQNVGDRFALGASVVLPPEAASLDGQRLPIAQPVEFRAWDVVVAGTGTAGAVAAIAAGQAGARTLAFDLAAAPGGMGTGGGVSGYFHGASGGIQDELDERSRDLSELMTGARPIASRWHHEAKICALLERFEATKVHFLRNALLCGVERDVEGRVTAALVAHEGRVLRIPSLAWVDGTGDGDLCAMAGADYLYGREGDRRPMAFTQVGFWITRRTQKLNTTFSNYDAGWIDPSDARDLTRARLIGLSQYRAIEQSEDEQLVAMAPMVGLRQSRQICTDRMISLADMAAGNCFDDAIGSVDTVADTHSVDFEFETDALAFYYWICRGFRHRLHCDLPYRMLLPKGLRNVWIACRAAGINMEANTGLRMQREMQRLGEAAGHAAALSRACEGDSRHIDLPELLRLLDLTGARSTRKPPVKQLPGDELLALLDEGRPGIYLWHLSQRWAEIGPEVRQRLASAEPRVSFYAATLCAMANDAQAAPRLIAAVNSREMGPTPKEFRVNGAHGECIDIPFWLQGIMLLRRIGGREALPALDGVLREESLPFNVLTSIALTLERMARRIGPDPELIRLVERIAGFGPEDVLLPPSRSLWRTLHGEPQRPLPNNRGLLVRDDHRWQLDLVIHRTRRYLNLSAHAAAEHYRRDARGVIRRAFAEA